ncbi:hypothetical protein OROMI_000558 [Orobanche minor]
MNYAGEDLDPLSLRELQSLQHQLDTALKRIRTRKNQLMLESISQLQKKISDLSLDQEIEQPFGLWQRSLCGKDLFPCGLV